MLIASLIWPIKFMFVFLKNWTITI